MKEKFRLKEECISKFKMSIKMEEVNLQNGFSVDLCTCLSVGKNNL